MDQVANWRIEDAVALIVQGLIDHAKPYDVETDPAKARTAMETLLHRGGIPAPWSLSAILDTEPEPSEQLHGRAQVLTAWVTDAVSETPDPAELKRHIDASRQAIGFVNTQYLQWSILSIDIFQYIGYNGSIDGTKHHRRRTS